MISLALRNWKLYYRDKGTVFFSFLGVIIIIGLYILFLHNTVASEISVNKADFLTDSWIMAGIIAAASVTTCMAAYGTMVKDRENGIYKDFYSSPINKNKIVFGYMINGMIVGIMMSTLTFVLAEVYIVINGGEMLSIVNIMKVLGVIVLSVFSSSAMVGFIVSFIHSSNAFSGCSTTTGAAIGFLVGAYIPIGQLPSGVQTALKFFPTSHSAVLLRNIMMESAMNASFTNVPAEYVHKFKENMGMIFMYNNSEATITVSILFLIISGFLFYLLAILNMTYLSKKKLTD